MHKLCDMQKLLRVTDLAVEVATRTCGASAARVGVS
jgi:hypothetical protein